MANTQFKRCAVYTRVSTDNQAEKEFSSCEAQEEKIKYFVESQNDFSIVKVYSDAGFTGANTNRPALQELLSDIKEGKIDLILAYKIDRLTRSPKDFYQLIDFFEKYAVDFISITERFDTSTPSGRLLRNIMLTFAQFERELTSERTKDKMLERAKKGMSNGGLTPYGYRRENKKLVIEKKEAEIVKSVYENYLNSGSLFKIYDDLKEKGVKNKFGNYLSKSNLEHILRNITYSGKVRHRGQIYQGIHEPIISEEVFNLAQEIHKKKIKKFRVYKNFLFGGLIKCADCGSRMTSVFTNKRKDGKLSRYYYYRCTSTMKKDWQACSTRQVSAERLERYVMESLERISKDKEYIENLVFRLNSPAQPPVRAGFELPALCGDLTAEKGALALKTAVSEIGRKAGIEKNLLAKRFFKEIIYSKENITIGLFLLQNQAIPVSAHSPHNSARSAQNFANEKAGLLPLPAFRQFVSASGLRG
ncbi:MAG: recombinase family protein [Candidatus Paceibacterota bacterium]